MEWRILSAGTCKTRTSAFNSGQSGEHQSTVYSSVESIRRTVVPRNEFPFLWMMRQTFLYFTQELYCIYAFVFVFYERSHRRELQACWFGRGAFSMYVYVCHIFERVEKNTHKLTCEFALTGNTSPCSGCLLLPVC